MSENKVYRMCITETSSRIVDIEVTSYDEACSKLKESWENEEIILDSDDFDGIEIDGRERYVNESSLINTNIEVGQRYSPNDNTITNLRIVKINDHTLEVERCEHHEGLTHDTFPISNETLLANYTLVE